jgi:1-acyl-sn-glycerol-3-phosphate acyltransferase
MEPKDVVRKRPLDKLRATLRFFIAILGTNISNVIYGSGHFMFVWWFRDWCYWKFGVGCMRSYLRWAGLRTNVMGLEKIRTDRPALYISSHKSHMDIPATMSALPVRFFFIAKKELQRIPIFGWALPTFGMIMIDRSTREKAYQSIKEAVQRIREEKQDVLIYPEGGISKSGRLKAFKKGGFALAIEAGVPIVPIVLHNSGNLFSVHRMKCRPGVVDIEVLDEIDPAGFSEDQKEELMDVVHNAMEEAEERYLSRK